MSVKLKKIFFLSIIFFIVDQMIKFYLCSKLVLNQSIILIKNFLNITYVHNDGAAFSLFRGNRWLLIIIGILALIFFIIYIAKLDSINQIDLFSYSLLLGGILGNLFDRIIYGYVVDYISLNIFGYYFPIFNFADMCIVIGVILMIFSSFKGDLWKK